MAVGSEHLVSEGIIESPELALVDPDLRARARQALRSPAERPAPERSRPSRPHPDLPASIGSPAPVENRDVGDALRRLTELSELEPIKRQRRSTKLLSLAFAACSWGVLAIVVADVQPWRL